MYDQNSSKEQHNIRDEWRPRKAILGKEPRKWRSKHIRHCETDRDRQQVDEADNSTITKAIKSKQNNGRDEENVDPALFYYLSEHHLQHAQESGQVSLLIDEPIISYPKTL